MAPRALTPPASPLVEQHPRTKPKRFRKRSQINDERDWFPPSTTRVHTTDLPSISAGGVGWGGGGGRVPEVGGGGTVAVHQLDESANNACQFCGLICFE
ncbi:hypothetical protein BHE74_00003194 [Ensete ventricosum]|nr:hypothetical protein BHE74_00003194 [Ensete ventricosum]